jgi:hypothetical protein
MTGTLVYDDVPRGDCFRTWCYFDGVNLDLTLGGVRVTGTGTAQRGIGVVPVFHLDFTGGFFELSDNDSALPGYDRWNLFQNSTQTIGTLSSPPTPRVPEPATLTLLLGGLAAAYGLRRRSR